MEERLKRVLSGLIALIKKKNAQLEFAKRNSLTEIQIKEIQDLIEQSEEMLK